MYLYQGLVAGFATTALVNHFAATGFPAAEVGRHLAVVGLPWVLQPLLWGPLIDGAAPRRMGTRRFWLVLALVGAQASLSGLCILGSAPSLAAVSAVLFLHSLFASLADTATDRMLADTVPESELGRTSACTRAGFVVGSAIGAGLFGWWLGAAGFAQAATGLLAITTALVVGAGLVREAPGDALVAAGRGREPAKGRSASFGPVVSFVGRIGRAAGSFRDREAALLLLMCFGTDFALALFQVPFGVALVQERGWEPAALSSLQAGLGLVAGTVGAAAMGLYVDRAGPARALLTLLLACAAAFAAAACLIAAGWGDRMGPLILGLSSVVPALLYVALLPTVVLASRAQGASATQFQILMAAMNLGDVVGALVAGEVDRRLGPALTACGVALFLISFAAIRARPAQR